VAGIGVIGGDDAGEAPYAYVLGEPARPRRTFEDAAAFLAGRSPDAVAIAGPPPARQRALSALAVAFGGAVPPIALVGRDGPVARSLGLPGGGAGRLTRLVDAWHRDLPFETRAVDTLRVDDGRLGFCFGTGLVRGFAGELSREAPVPGLRAGVSLLLRAAGSALWGGPLARRLHEPRRARVEADGAAWPAERFAAILAGTVARVAPGFAPFRRAGELPRTFHLIGLACTPRAAVGEVLRALAGREFSRTGAIDAVAREATLVSDRPWRYLLDGTPFTGGETVRLAVGPRIEVIA
jgi:hypothetical protein